jgi:dTDP-4-dehydrorhamnose reductase
LGSRPPRILLTGASGQLGRELAAWLPDAGVCIACDRAALDLADASAIATKVRDVAPDVIVNAAAYTAVDRAESERDAAFAINAHAVDVLAREAKRANALLVHYSTDYVFDGERCEPYDESAPVNPQNVYGASKLAGEHAIGSSGACAVTLRTSWVYGRHGANFLLTMQRLARSSAEIRVVADQTGVPNWSRWLAQTTAHLLAMGIAHVRERSGLYHLSARGSTTWHGFAKAILADQPAVQVTPITTADWPTAARRPRHAVLDGSRFASTFDVRLPDWQTLLHECLRAPAEPDAARLSPSTKRNIA